MVEAFGIARSKDLGHDELAHVAKGAPAGREATLLVEADREVPGRIDAATVDATLLDVVHAIRGLRHRLNCAEDLFEAAAPFTPAAAT